MAAASSTMDQQHQHPPQLPKKKANLVSPFANVHLSSALGLVAEATRASLIKTNPAMAVAAAKKKAAAAAAGSQGDDEGGAAVDDDDDLLAQVKVDPRQVSAAALRTSVRALVVTPSVVKAPPKAGGAGKKPFPGFCAITVMVLGPPGAKGNVVGLRTPGNSQAPHGRVAYLAAEQLEKTGFNEETQKNEYKQRPSDEKAVLTEGTLIDLTVTGQVARPTHKKDGTKVPDEQLAAQPELKIEDVVSITLNEIVLRDGNIQARATRIQPLGSASDLFSNQVLHSLAEASQRPYTPLVVREDFDWASVKVERKKKDGDAAAPAAPDQEGGAGGGGDAMDEDGAPSNDKPNNDKVQKVGSACMTPAAARALWTNYVVGTIGVPRDTQQWREAAGMPLVLNGAPVFDPTDPQQWIKKQKEDAPPLKPGDTPEVQIRYALPTRQVEWLTPVQCSVTPVMLSQTVPQLLLYRFGISDRDYQPFVRALIANGVFAMMASPMTQGWMTRYFDGAEFTQAFYPKMNYVGVKGSKKPDVKSAAFFVDHACTLLNSTVPVTREFIMVLMMTMTQFVDKRRFNFNMNMVKKADRKDRAGRLIEDNYLDTRVDDEGAQAVVNIFECQYDITKELLAYSFYALLEDIPKSAEVLQQVFANNDPAVVPAYFSAMLLQALLAQIQQTPGLSLPDPLRPIDAANAFLKKVADDMQSQASMGMGAAPLPDDFVRPKGAPSLRELLAKDSPLYIGDNALGLSAEQLKTLRVLPWAISTRHLEQRGLPAIYAGTAVHYDVVYPQLARDYDEDEGLLPLQEMIEMRKRDIAPLLEAEFKRREEEANKLSPEEEAAIKAIEDKAMAEAAAAAKAKATATATPPSQKAGPPPAVPARPKKAAAATATMATKSALTAAPAATGTKRAAKGEPVSLPPQPEQQVGARDIAEVDDDSEHTRRQRQRKMPASFQAPPETNEQEVYDDEDEDEEDDNIDVDVDATQPQEGGGGYGYAGAGGVLTLAPDDD